MSPSTATAVLKAASAGVAGFGLIIALAAWPPTAGPADVLADLVLWPLDASPRIDTPAARLLAAIAGGVLVGWGVTLWLVTAHVLPKDESAAAGMIRASILSWFAVDSFASVAAGAPLNAALNVGFLVAFLWPLAGPTRSAGSGS